MFLNNAWYVAQWSGEVQGEAFLASTLLSTPVPRGYTGALAALRDSDLRDNLASAGVPTLVISSQDDLPVPADHMALIAESLAGAADMRLQGRHLSLIEAPGDITKVVNKFLAVA